jgi:DNA repair exonuclease SbcCD ATPase subunit
MNKPTIPYGDTLASLSVELPQIEKTIEGSAYHLRIEERKKKLHLKNKEIEALTADSTALIRLKQLAVDAECYQLQTTVDDINYTMNEILEEIFDEPITVTLKLFKELKSKKGLTKPTINLSVLYHGVEYDGISGLSGGEGDRISMALTLALNFTSPSPFLIMDESLSSLDARMRIRCLNAMRKMCQVRGTLGDGDKEMKKGKYIMCVNHEDIEGNYDEVLRVSRKRE